MEKKISNESVIRTLSINTTVLIESGLKEKELRNVSDALTQRKQLK